MQLSEGAEILSKKYQLSKRQTDVLKAIMINMPQIEISQKMQITVKTVKFHITCIYKSMKIKPSRRPAFHAQVFEDLGCWFVNDTEPLDFTVESAPYRKQPAEQAEANNGIPAEQMIDYVPEEVPVLPASSNF